VDTSSVPNHKLDTEIVVRLPSALRAQLEAIAVILDQTEGEVIRRALQNFIALVDHEPAALSAPSVQLTPEPSVELRDVVRKAVYASTNWQDCVSLLAKANLAFIARGGGLAIVDKVSGEILCKASQVGFGYADLMRKFRQPFPDHPATWLAEKILR
jgi:hypothetical protein